MKLKVEMEKTSNLVPYAGNAKEHPDEQVGQIIESIKQFGFNDPIGIWHNPDGEPVIVEGHGRLLAALELGLDEVPVISLDHLDDEGRRAYTLVHNQLTMNTGFDEAILEAELSSIPTINMAEYGFDIEEILDTIEAQSHDAEECDEPSLKLKDRFGFVPFSVQNAARGEWQDRKAQWLALGIKSETGRTQDLCYRIHTLNLGGTSIFDPNVCELNYTWFTKEGDTILDPFAGGSVRGIVAHILGRQYTGIELRQEQVIDNEKQRDEICSGNNLPIWHTGDSMKMEDYIDDQKYDHVFTCPPYGDLEKYSDDPADISNMTPDDFDAAYIEIIKKAVEHLNEDRFATIVVGNYRDKQGNERDLAGLTIQAMEAAGCKYYNDIILKTTAGSAAARAGNQFTASRKICKIHQYILVFVKGDARKATQRLTGGPISKTDSIKSSAIDARTTSVTVSFDNRADADIVKFLDGTDNPQNAILELTRKAFLAMKEE